MGTARRFVYDESGMTLALAMMMILLIGVMGAGLLAFVNSDLNTVVEENRGQRAFEVAEAGIEAAKGQLASNVDRTKYDDPSGAPVDDIQWSAARGGLTLNNLDGDATTSDSANVKIAYKPAVGQSPEYFQVISLGTYGAPPRQSMRRIEARFKGVALGGSGGAIGHPLYYTPGSISVDGPEVNLNSISMFAGGDILIERDTTQTSFVNDYESGSNGETLKKFTGKSDALCNWRTDVPENNQCFVGTTGPYNTVARTIIKNGNPVNYDQPGFGAEGKICGFPDNTTPPGTCGTSASIADGVYAYDSTTGNKGNNLQFVGKNCNPTCQPNTAGTISYPFPRPNPNPSGLLDDATCQNRTYTYTPGTPPNWDNLFSPIPAGGYPGCNNATQKVVFVDAGNRTLHFQTNNSAKNTGLLVVWCGRLEMDQNFSGMIINLIGTNLAGHTQCTNTTATLDFSSGQPDGKTDGTYINNGQQCQCWTYAQGGTPTLAGIQIGPGSKIDFYQADWSFLDNAFTGPPPTNFRLRNWRELYQASP